ncbi:MAG: sulfur oxidation c-type cytochrome SoxX [Proteobacteria bacterium]|nr:MAG: sulfur oxidation c-type cytochrome SoxX [Pseudomonadota bacterium]
MLRSRKTLATLGLAAAISAGAAIFSTAAAETYPAESGCGKLENPSVEQKGWCVAVNRRLGNCLGCHTILVDPWPEGFPPGGNVAPPLVSMKQRFPDAGKLRAQIFDPTQFNENTRMPPFGKHDILTEDQIDAIVAFLMTI